MLCSSSRGLTKTDSDHFLAHGTKFPAHSLPKHMQLLGHTQYLDVLKVDVESMEYRAFQGLSVGECASADVRVGQLLVELRTPPNKKAPGSTVKRLFSFVSPSVAFADFQRVNPIWH